MPPKFDPSEVKIGELSLMNMCVLLSLPRDSHSSFTVDIICFQCIWGVLVEK
jgi:hypothetical protein